MNVEPNEYLDENLLDALLGEDFDALEQFDLFACDTRGQNLLFYAIRQKVHRVFAYLLERGLSVNQENHFKDTPLHAAAYIGEADMVSALLQKDAAIDARNKKGITPLMFAARKGDLKTVETLLNAGADLSIRDKEGLSVAFHAVRSKKREVFEYLLDAGANPFAFSAQRDTLHHAVAAYGTLPMQKRLFEEKLTPYIKNLYGVSPLHEASKRSDNAMVDNLLFYGLSPSEQDRFQNDAFAYAQEAGDVSMQLYRFENRPKIRENLGSLPLHKALRKGRYDEAEALIKMRRGIDQKDCFYNKPLFYALLNGDIDLIKALLESGVSAFDIDAFGHSAIFYAILFKNLKAIELLKDKKKDVLDKPAKRLLKTSDASVQKQFFH